MAAATSAALLSSWPPLVHNNQKRISSFLQKPTTYHPVACPYARNQRSSFFPCLPFLGSNSKTLASLRKGKQTLKFGLQNPSPNNVVCTSRKEPSPLPSLRINHLQYSSKGFGNFSGLRGNQRSAVVVNVLSGGGGPNDDSGGKQLGRLLGAATWGIIIWSALTGQLNWFFEGLTTITLIILAIPALLLLAFVAFYFRAKSRQIEGPCPTCGAPLSIVPWSDNMMVVDTANPVPVQVPISDDLAFDCPTCRASLKVEDKRIVRGRPSFESGVDANVFSQMFDRQQAQSRGKSTAASQPIVDIEAEVLDKD